MLISDRVTPLIPNSKVTKIFEVALCPLTSLTYSNFVSVGKCLILSWNCFLIFDLSLEIPSGEV